ncbi:hypothetical protein M2401_004996 [Pseudomonas sp. JUb42]|nr:hypothetical protein [Pseudomonas sp. JUb42]
MRATKSDQLQVWRGQGYSGHGYGQGYGPGHESADQQW